MYSEYTYLAHTLLRVIQNTARKMVVFGKTHSNYSFHVRTLLPCWEDQNPQLSHPWQHLNKTIP